MKFSGQVARGRNWQHSAKRSGSASDDPAKLADLGVPPRVLIEEDEQSATLDSRSGASIILAPVAVSPSERTAQDALCGPSASRVLRASTKSRESRPRAAAFSGFSPVFAGLRGPLTQSGRMAVLSPVAGDSPSRERFREQSAQRRPDADGSSGTGAAITSSPSMLLKSFGLQV